MDINALLAEGNCFFDGLFKKVCNPLLTSLELLIKGKICIGMHPEDTDFVT